jgi:tetratricopeptide (TPR) repeat protein
LTLRQEGAVLADRAEALACAAVDDAERGRLGAAEAIARQGLDVALSIVPGTDRNRALAIACQALGAILRTLGRYREADAQFRVALDAAESAFGRDSDEVVGLLNDIGMTGKFAGRFAMAEAAYLRARGIVEGQPDHDPDDLAALLHNLAGLAHARGDFAAAEPLARRGIAIRVAAVGPDDPVTLLDWSAYASILDGLSRSDEASEVLRRILPDLIERLGRDHLEVAVALNNLAAIVQRRGDLVAAEALYRRVLEIKTARLGDGSPALAVALNNLATALRAQNRTDEALALYERALGLLIGTVEDEHPNLVAIRRNLAALRIGPSVRERRRACTSARQ